MRTPIVLVLLLLAAAVHAQPRTVESAPGSSTMTYVLTHPLHHVEATSADARYTVTIDPAQRTIAAVEARVDVTTFNSGNSNRDSHAMEVIDALSFPDAHFVSTNFWTEGSTLKVQGKLTFHGVTNDVVIDAHPVWSDHALAVSGTFAITLSAFHVERPSLLMIPVDDALTFRFSASFAY